MDQFPFKAPSIAIDHHEKQETMDGPAYPFGALEIIVGSEKQPAGVERPHSEEGVVEPNAQRRGLAGHGDGALVDMLHGLCMTPAVHEMKRGQHVPKIEFAAGGPYPAQAAEAWCDTRCLEQ